MVVAMIEDEQPLIIRLHVSARDWAEHASLPIKLGFACPLNHGRRRVADTGRERAIERCGGHD